MNAIFFPLCVLFFSTALPSLCAQARGIFGSDDYIRIYNRTNGVVKCTLSSAVVFRQRDKIAIAPIYKDIKLEMNAGQCNIIELDLNKKNIQELHELALHFCVLCPEKGKSFLCGQKMDLYVTSNMKGEVCYIFKGFEEREEEKSLKRK